MKYVFSTPKDDVYFLFHEKLPENIGKWRINMAALTLWGNYRTAIRTSYQAKPDLAPDIKAFNQNPLHIEKGRIVNSDPVDNYALYATGLGIRKLNEGTAKSYIAYQKDPTGYPRKIGFASFYEEKINGKSVIYISDAMVNTDFKGKSVGRRLMQCVLAHYPAGTEFYILTRKFNSEAIALYRDRLGFSPTTLEELKALDYDERYVGFKHTTDGTEIVSLRSKMCF